MLHGLALGTQGESVLTETGRPVYRMSPGSECRHVVQDSRSLAPFDFDARCHKDHVRTEGETVQAGFLSPCENIQARFTVRKCRLEVDGPDHV